MNPGGWAVAENNFTTQIAQRQPHQIAGDLRFAIRIANRNRTKSCNFEHLGAQIAHMWECGSSLEKTFPIVAVSRLARNITQMYTKPGLTLEPNLASRWEEVRLPRASGKLPHFNGSYP